MEKTSKYSCPHCGNKISFDTTFIMGIFTKIKCSECGSILKPDSTKSMLINGLMGLLFGLSSFLGTEIAQEYGKVLGIMAIIVSCLGILLAGTAFMYFNLPLKIHQKGESVYFKGGAYRKALNSETDELKIGIKEEEKIKSQQKEKTNFAFQKYKSQ